MQEGLVRAAVVFSFLSLFPAQAARDRITDRVDLKRTTLLEKNIHPRALPQLDQGSVDGSFLLTHVTLIIKQSAEQKAALDQLLEDQRDPSSPEYTTWLSPEQFGERFGASQSDIRELTFWLESEGLVVAEVARGLNWISFDATADQIGRIFKTQIHHYLVDGELRYANQQAPSVPAAFSAVVESLNGLNDFRMKPSTAGSLKKVPDYTSRSSHYLSPDDLASIYDLTPLLSKGFDGTGQKIVIAGQTDINLADIRAFRSNFNLPAKDPQLVLYGRDPGTSPEDQVEADLDLEWAGATARNATIIYVYSTDVITSVQYAVNQNLAPIISLSYGGCEPYNSSGLRSLAQQANAEGITWVVASGDTGAAACGGTANGVNTGLAVSYPASIPEVTAVGGTEFMEGSGNYWSAANNSNLGSALSYIPEMAWNDPVVQGRISATGGGASIFYAKPSWQTGAGVPNDNARDLPDISLAASADHDGYLVYTGGLMVVGGTSASAPSFAGILSILNQYLVSKSVQPKAGLGNVNPALYHLAQTSPNVFHDITVGSNIVPCTVGTKDCTTGSLGYSAGPGYDLVTGLGSVDANNLITYWNSVAANISTTTSIAASSLSLLKGDTAQLTVTVKPGSGSSAPSGNVTFIAGTTTLGTVALSGAGTAATAALTINGSMLVAGTNRVTANYSGSTSMGSSTASMAITSVVGTTMTMVPSPATFFNNAGTVLTVTIKPVTGNVAPGGTVTFSASGKSLGAATLNPSGVNGIAQLTLSADKLQTGANTISASYSGATGFGVSSGTTIVGVTTLPVTTVSLKLTASPASIASSGSTQLTAALSTAAGIVPPSGTVTFSLGSTVLGTAQLVGSRTSPMAVLTVAGLKLKSGANAITASYAATGASGASSSVVTVTVTGSTASSHVTATITPNPVYEVHGSWTVTIHLAEISGTPTTITAFTINETNLAAQIGQFFGTPKLPANGTLNCTVQFTNVPFPATGSIAFSGSDANGHVWSQVVPVKFVGPQSTGAVK